MIAIYCWFHRIVQGHGIIILMVQLIHKIPNNFGLEVVGTLSLFIGICWFLANYFVFFLLSKIPKAHSHKTTSIVAQMLRRSCIVGKKFLVLHSHRRKYSWHLPTELPTIIPIIHTKLYEKGSFTQQQKRQQQWQRQRQQPNHSHNITHNGYLLFAGTYQCSTFCHNKDTRPITQHMEIMLMK